MKLPKIDLASLPDLHTVMAKGHDLVGMFGSMRSPGGGHDDSAIVLMTIIYSTNPPGGGII
jgi:hypothetical protein